MATTTQEEAKLNISAIAELMAGTKVPKPTTDPSYANKMAREKYTEVEPPCVVKVIARPRIYGTRGTIGSILAKSAVRLAIDTKVLQPVVHEKADLKTSLKETVKVFHDVPTRKAIDFLNHFEMKFGGKTTKTVTNKQNVYQTAKRKALADLNIPTDATGRPLFRSEESQKQYFERLKGLTFEYVEVYVSVKPKDVRATQSKKIRLGGMNEAQIILDQLEIG